MKQPVGASGAASYRERRPPELAFSVPNFLEEPCREVSASSWFFPASFFFRSPAQLVSEVTKTAAGIAIAVWQEQAAGHRLADAGDFRRQAVFRGMSRGQRNSIIYIYSNILKNQHAKNYSKAAPQHSRAMSGRRAFSRPFRPFDCRRWFTRSRPSECPSDWQATMPGRFRSREVLGRLVRPDRIDRVPGPLRPRLRATTRT
jgi:hypothetical protein